MEERIIPAGPPPEPMPRGAQLWALWALVTALGWAAAGALVGALPVMEAGVLQYAVLPLSAVGQWLVLRQHFGRASAWLLATSGGVAVAALAYWVLMVLPDSLMGPSTSGLRQGISLLIDGFAIGIAQWLVLRQNVRGMDRWIPATGMPLWIQGFDALRRGAEGSSFGEIEAGMRITAWAVSTGLIGLFIGAMTGGVLAWMVDQPRVWDEGEGS